MKVVFKTDDIKPIVNRMKLFTDNQYIEKDMRNHIFIKCVGGTATISAIDMESSIKSTLQCEGDDIDIAVPAKKFILMVDSFTSDTITLKTVKGEVVVSSGNRKLKLPVLDIQILDDIPVEDGSIELLLDDNIISIFKSNHNIILNKGFQMWALGLNIKKIDGSLLTFCTDGYWMLSNSIGEYDGKIDELFLTKDSVKKITEMPMSNAKLMIGDRSIYYLSDNIEMRILNTAVVMPPFNKAIESLSNVTDYIEFNGSDLQDEINILTKLYDVSYVKVESTGDKLLIRGDGFEGVYINCKGVVMKEFNIDPRKLSIFLKRNKGDVKLYTDEDVTNIKLVGGGDTFTLNKMI